MTPQEAIGFIKSEVQIDVRFCSDEKVDKTIEVFELAISALEKQIPKKVTKSACPSCNRIFLFRHSEKRKGDYCDNCGQALDWSENND